jgi:hypothetical protein
MTHEIGVLSKPRELTQTERELTVWLLKHGAPGSEIYLTQLDSAMVFSHCKCGCASVDFIIGGNRPKSFALGILADYKWRDEKGNFFGIFAFEQDNLLGGIDVWSVDGAAIPTTLPAPSSLVP